MTSEPGFPHWLPMPEVQANTAVELVRRGAAAWIGFDDYPLQATKVLQLHRLDERGDRRGKLYVARDGKIYGPGYTWREARYKLWEGHDERL